MTLNFKDQVVLITGSTKGIGWATAQLFAQGGAKVLLNGKHSQESLDNRVEELKDKFGIESEGYLFDVSNHDAVKSIYSEIFKSYKRLDVLVNNAGIMNSGLLGMLQKSKLEEMLDVNLKGAIYNLQFASRLMGRSKSGSIINLCSILGTQGLAGQAAYAASKAGLLGLTSSAAKELAPYNIRVNAVAPGMINTEMASKGMTDKAMQKRIEEIGMGRLGEPNEVAQVICFLASPAASYVTGQTIGIDGAWSL
jgi:3-oxoacyl-[acyl-carrier protein] reductase